MSPSKRPPKVLYFPGIDGYDDSCWARSIKLKQMVQLAGAQYVEPPVIQCVKDWTTLSDPENRLSTWYKKLLKVYSPILENPEQTVILISYSRGTAMLLQTLIKHKVAGVVLAAPFLYDSSVDYDELSSAFKVSEDLEMYKNSLPWNVILQNVPFINLITDRYDLKQIQHSAEIIRNSITTNLKPENSFAQYTISSKDHFLSGLPELGGVIRRLVSNIQNQQLSYNVLIKPKTYYGAIKTLVPLIARYIGMMFRKKESLAGFTSHVKSWRPRGLAVELVIKASGLQLLRSVQRKFHESFTFEVTPLPIEKSVQKSA